MEYSLNGLLGVVVQLHAVEDLKQELDPVLLHKMEDRIARETALSSSHVTANLVQLMECGLAGLHGVIVQLLAVEAFKQQLEPVLHHNMEVKTARDPAVRSRHVMFKLVQLMECGLAGLLGALVQLHVVEELKQELDPAHHQNMEDKIARETALSRRNVTQKLAVLPILAVNL